MNRSLLALGLSLAIAPAFAQPAQAPAAPAAPAPAAAVVPPAAPTPPPAAAMAPPPDTDVFVADLDLAAGKAGAPKNVTERVGYDNQPAFLADGSGLLYVAIAEPGAAGEVWRYDFASGARSQVTHTAEAEYSPTPLADGSGFSAVRVEAPDAKGEAFTESQKLFKYGFDGKPIGPVLAGLTRVGYHAWLDATHVAVFIVGNPDAKVANTLQVVSLPDGKRTPLAQDIGRSLGRAPDGRVTFVDQSVANTWQVVAMKPGDAKPTVLVAPPANAAGEGDGDRSMDFCWLPDGTLLMAHGDKLLRWDGKPGSAWTTLAEYPDLPGTIKRLAASRDGKHVAFVVEMRAAPRTRGIRG